MRSFTAKFRPAFRTLAWVLPGFLPFLPVSVWAHSDHPATGHAHAMSMTSAGDPSVAPRPADAPPDVRWARTVTVAADPHGRLWLAYVNGQTLYVQQRRSDGHYAVPIAVNALPETIINSGENRPQLAFGPDREIFVAWSGPLDGPWTSQVRFARAADGVHFSPPVTINHDHQNLAHYFPVMRTNARGDIFIAWLDQRDHAAALKAGQPYRGMAVYYNWSTDLGASFQPRDLLVAPESCECCRLAMTIRDDLPVIAFRKIYPHSIRDHALVTFRSCDQPNPPERFSFDHWQLDACPEKGPAIWAAGDKLHLIWYDNGRLYSARREAGRLSPASTIGGRGAGYPAIVGVGGILNRVWRQSGGAGASVWLETSRDQGAHWSPARTIAKTDGPSDLPELTVAAGQIWLSWQTQKDGFKLLLLHGEPSFPPTEPSPSNPA